MSNQYRILVIEDDWILRNNICEILRNESYTCEEAENGKTGLLKVDRFYPDLIISDVMMPELNGFEVLEELMKKPATAGIPFIFLTAKAEYENLRKAMNLGASDYLFKPFDIDELLEAVKIRLKKKSIDDQKIMQLQRHITQKLPHELRTPLVPILGYSELIEDEGDINQIKDMAKLIGKSGKILHNRIEKFLLYKDLIMSEAEKQDHISEQTTTLICSNLVLQSIGLLPPEINAADRVEIEIEPCFVPINELYTGTLINELVENGLKYSDKKVSIKGNRTNGSYYIRINDKGRGFTEREIQSISAFYKFGENQLSERGLGLGLSIVKKISELHNLKFSITSRINEFTTCEIAIHL